MGDQSSQRIVRYWQAELEALQQEMRRDPRIVLLGEDIAGAAGKKSQGFVEGWGGPYGTTRGLVQEFGRERVIDTPISEAGFLGAAAGLAEGGLRPWVEVMFPSFMMVCLDQLITNIAQKHHLFAEQGGVPVVIKTLINNHGVLYSIATHIPGLKIVAPSNPYTVKGLMIAALRSDDPVIVFDNISLLRTAGHVPEEPYEVEIGKAFVAQEGTDVTLVGISAMTQVCLDAATALAAEGVGVEVIDLLSLAPLDEATLLASLRKTGRLVVVDEGFPRCSLARDIVAQLSETAFDAFQAAPKTVTAPAFFKPFSGPLAAQYAPSRDRVVEAVRAVVDGGKPHTNGAARPEPAAVNPR